MFKRDITFTDFDGNTVTETHYFNLMKSEIIEMNYSQEGGMIEFIEGIVKSGADKAILEQFRRFITESYGQRSPDGKRFIKSAELTAEFEQTLAFDQLYMELMSSDQAATEFIIGILPEDMKNRAAEALDQQGGVTGLAGQVAQTGSIPVPPPPATDVPAAPLQELPQPTPPSE